MVHPSSAKDNERLERCFEKNASGKSLSSITLKSEADALTASASYNCILHNYMALMAMEERARL